MKKYLIPGSHKVCSNKTTTLPRLNGAVGASLCGRAGKQGIILKFNVISQSTVRENISDDMHILSKCCVAKDVLQLAEFSA